METSPDKLWSPDSGDTRSFVALMRAMQQSVQDAIKNFAPSGMIAQFAGTEAPDGWLLCKGQAVSRSTYSGIFSATGTFYGEGNGSSTFNLPNFQSRMAVGQNASDPEFQWHGKTGGAKEVVLGVGQLPAHQHRIIGGDDGNTRLRSGRAGMDTFPEAGAWAPWFGTGHNSEDNVWAAPEGKGEPHSNMSPYLVCSFIIKI
ncbi:MAG: tail fiber protein [Microbacterium gubbeenense]|uniref:phage tail protein n=1 Tax=Microbacterium gubbeenense TaxID=159896 RepID=UPI003F98BD69